MTTVRGGGAGRWLRTSVSRVPARASSTVRSRRGSEVHHRLPAGSDAEHGVAFGDEPRRWQIVQHVRELVSVAPLLGVEGDPEVDRGGAGGVRNAQPVPDRGPPSTGTLADGVGDDRLVRPDPVVQTGAAAHRATDPNGDLLRTSWFRVSTRAWETTAREYSTFPVGHAGTVGGERVDAVSGHGVAGTEISANHTSVPGTFHQPGVGVLLVGEAVDPDTHARKLFTVTQRGRPVRPPREQNSLAGRVERIVGEHRGAAC